MFSQDENLLKDLTATYQFLADRSEASEVKQLLTPYRDEPLFLNVNHPSVDQWEFLPATRITLNIPDDGEFREARKFLGPFRPLLIAAGAFEFWLVPVPHVDSSPAEEELSVLRAGFEGLRTGRLFTDVVFRAPGVHGAMEVWAHRALLATASEFFHNLFSDGFIESRPASVVDPIVIEMETLEEFQCAEMVIREYSLPLQMTVDHGYVCCHRIHLHRTSPQAPGQKTFNPPLVSCASLANGPSVRQDRGYPRRDYQCLVVSRL